MNIKTWIRNFLRRTGAFILVTLLALISLSFIVHIPAVQKFGIQHITGILSNIAGTRVTVDKFSFNFFNSLSFSALYVETPGQTNDTLLFANEMDVRFANLVTLARGRLNIREIGLDGVHLHFTRADSATASNLQMILDNFSTGGRTRKEAGEDKRGLRIRAGKFTGTDMHVLFEDDLKKTVQEYRLERGTFDFKKIVLDSSILRLNSADIDGLEISIWKYAATGNEESIADSTQSGRPFRLEVDALVLDKGQFRLLNESKDTAIVGGMNYNNLRVDSININIEGFGMEELNFEGVVHELSFIEQSGFELNSLKVDQASVSDTGLILNGVNLVTDKSRLSDTIRFEYSSYTDWRDFVNEVYLYGDFIDADLAISDLLSVVPGLRKNRFFSFNEDKAFRFSGVVSGNVNSLRVTELNGRLGDLIFEGDFRSRNLTVKNEQFLNLRVNRVITSASILRSVIPNFTLTSQYDKLGRINFSGRFDGFLNDFVADGEVYTALGSASLDMRLDITEGLQKAEYSGGIGLDSFDIGAWSENPDLGRITASAQILKGEGLTSETANAVIQGGITSLGFKGYTYRNAVLNGTLDENYFSGDLEVVDKNITLRFDGTVDMRSEDPKFDFLTTIDTLDLLALNILKDTFLLSGQFEVSGTITPSRGIDGFARASNVHIERGINEVYDLDTIGLTSEPDGNINHYRFTSDYINGKIDGDFALVAVIPQMKRYLGTHYPALFGYLITEQDTTGISPARINYDLTLGKPEEWSGIFNIKNLDFEMLTLRGKFDLVEDSLTLSVYSPRIQQGNIAGQMLDVSFVADSGRFAVDIVSDSVFLGNLSVAGLTFDGRGDDSRLQWDLGLQNMFDSLSIDLGGNFTYDSSGNYAINIQHRDAVLFDPAWDLHIGNRIAWGPDYIDIDSFHVHNGTRFIEVTDLNRRGVEVTVQNFDLSYLNEIWVYDKLNFAGGYSLALRIEDIRKRDQINLDFDMDQLVINSDSFGTLSAQVTTSGPGQPLVLKSFVGNETAPIARLDGTYDPNSINGYRVDMKATLSDFPGNFLENFLGGSIKNTKGTLTGVIELNGDTTNLVLDGKAWARGAATTVDVTGVRYRLRDFEVRLTNDYIDLSDAIIEDLRGNTASVSGGLTHHLMKNMGLDIRIQSPRIIGIDLPKTPDAVFYGTGIGAADVFFRGPTSDPNLLINATTAPGTRIYMPLDQGAGTNNEFLRFIERDSLGNIITQASKIVKSGMDLELNLTLTQDAQIDLIFDENTRDILRGVTEGDLQIIMNDAGDLALYGNVEVVQGNYLFTSLAVNKPFNIRSGGTIIFTGDPYDAQLNIVADYEGLRTSVSSLIEEYLVNASPTAQQEARQLTKVQLELILTGPLSSPEINFDIKFPDVTGELSGYLDNKMKTLQNDPNALNQQAFSLILLGTFLPSSDVSGVNSSSLASVGVVNTVSEFLSSQLSFYLTEFLSGAIEDVGFISGIDFDVGYNQSYDFVNNNAAVEEWEVHMRNRLFNDRFVVDVGGSYVTENPWTQGTYFAGDYALEYAITEDQHLKVRLYYRNEETIEGRKNKTGIGLSYRRDFDSFGDWLRGLEKEAKKMASDGSRDGEQQEPN